MSEDTDSVYYCSASLISKRGLIVLNKRPCRVSEIKEEDGKVHMVAHDILIEDKEYQSTFASDDEVGVPVVDRKNYQLQKIIKGKTLLLKSDDGKEKEMALPIGDLGEEIQRAFEKYGKEVMVLVISWENEEAAISFKAPEEDEGEMYDEEEE
uniref:Translation elongation factor IF5A C-terminal domain-containing protein n=1 Tax=Panagrolaimus sp. PS1159 TaxID=55785 RepID=A0AC35FNH1_9BILA